MVLNYSNRYFHAHESYQQRPAQSCCVKEDKIDNSSGISADRIGRGFYKIFPKRFIVIPCESFVWYEPKHEVPESWIGVDDW